MSEPSSLSLKASKCPNDRLALTNCVFVHPDDFAALVAGATRANRGKQTDNHYVMTPKKLVYTYRANETIKKGELGLSGVQRLGLYAALGDPIAVTPWVPPANAYLAEIKFEVDYYPPRTTGAADQIDTAKLTEIVRREFSHQCFAVGQKLVVDFMGLRLQLTALGLTAADLAALTSASATPGAAGPASSLGVITPTTDLLFSRAGSTPLRLTGEPGKGRGGQLFRPNWNFETMGIGGLDQEFSNLFRRAFASRVFPPALVSKLGINHVKGLLLYGPPGTGKTLMARQIGKMMNGKEPKIVNGPEILSKYVGESEKNIRELFADAEKEQKERGDESDLHIIIFDELDAICRQRGSRNDSTGVHDTVVNQLLSKIDGVDSLNNILVIGMTNRKELIDEALLRPGRLEVHIEISIPDKNGRLQILNIHTLKIRNAKMLDNDVDLSELAEITKNFSGAELEGLVRAASSFAFNRQIDPNNLTKPIDPDKMKISRADFESALNEITPAFGCEKDEMEGVMRGGIVSYGARWEGLLASARRFIVSLAQSDRTPVLSMLLAGPPGAGKTALAARLAMDSGSPFIRILSPDSLLGYSEQSKVSKITSTFANAYKSKMSVVVVDEIERLLEYVAIGPRFSNVVLQTLLTVFKRPPPAGHKLLIIGTTSNKDVLDDMSFQDVFDCALNVSSLVMPAEVETVLNSLGGAFTPKDAAVIASRFKGDVGVPIKKLLLIAEMARQIGEGGEDVDIVQRFLAAAREYGTKCFA